MYSDVVWIYIHQTVHFISWLVINIIVSKYAVGDRHIHRCTDEFIDTNTYICTCIYWKQNCKKITYRTKSTRNRRVTTAYTRLHLQTHNKNCYQNYIPTFTQQNDKNCYQNYIPTFTQHKPHAQSENLNAYTQSDWYNYRQSGNELLQICIHTALIVNITITTPTYIYL